LDEWHFVHDAEPKEEEWQSRQASLCSPDGMCSPTRGWRNVEGENPLVVWHPAQLELRPAWFEGAPWHAEQEEASPWKTPEAWHEVHGSEACRPVSGNRLWLKVEGTHPVGE
jgi:hypothetical protein